MIRRPDNWNEVKEFSDRPKLPLGAYVCKVKKAAVQGNEYGEQLCILFDIFEGDWKHFYADEYEANTQENKKWKGVLRQWLPRYDGSDKDEWTKSSLKGMVTAFEKSNPGYVFNWDESSLAGKMIGILFRNEEWEYEGKTGWAVRPYRAITVDSARSGDYRLPKDKPLKKEDGGFSPMANAYDNVSSFGAPSDFAIMTDDDSELPF